MRRLVGLVERAEVGASHASCEGLVSALTRIAGHESRADRRHRGMVDVSEVEGLQRTARKALDDFDRGITDDLDERQMTPAMQRTLDKTVKELERRVGAKAAQELLRKYLDAEGVPAA